MTKPFNWKIFFILLAGATLGLVAIIPYSLALQGGPPPQAQLPMPLPLLITVQIAAQVIVFGVATGIGLSFANSIGLGLPILEALLRKDRPAEPASVAPSGPVESRSTPAELFRAILPLSVIIGVVAGLLIIALDIFVFQPALHAQFGQAAPLVTAPTAKPAPWMGFLASFYGGIDEEILLRLCVMSFLAWLGRFISKTAEGKPTTAVLWTANVLAAVLFGLGHLPATAQLVPLTPLVVLRAVVLNGLAGIGFGWLYFKRGLEAAMLSHFSADIVLHVLFAI